MRSRHLFLLIYLLAICRETLSIERNGTCITSDTCAQVYDPTSHFLHCVGLPSTDTGKDHMMRLKGIIDAALDIYTFMRSSVAGVPILSLEGEIELNPGAEAFQDQALVQMWLQVKIKPLLNSISKHFLTCLSTKNFSCETYQTVVKEFSHYFSEMDPARQKWIYTFFMYPFLAREGLYGCVHPGQNSEEWLMKNFGSFKALARVEDFSALNMVFSGLEVLHLLSPEQKAELLLRPEVAGLDNGTLSLVFHSLMTGGPGPTPTSTPGYTYTSHNPYSPPSPPQNSFREVVNGLMGAFRPVGSLVSEFVSLTRERNVSEIGSMTLTQTLLNWTLAELAGMYTPHNTSIAPPMEEFDVTNVADWFNHVVTPLLRRFLPHGQLPDQIKFAFHQVFYLDMGNDTTEVQDTCSITLEERSCGLTNAVENVARFMHCAARSNLTMSEAMILRMITELTGRLTLLVNEFATANFSELASHFREVFAQVESPSLTQENLEDPHFIRMWFQIKLLPLLPTVPISLLDCLSFKNFTCPVYQALVKELSHHMRLMDPDHNHSPVMYEHFIHSFLLHHNTSDPQCVSSSSHSAEWLEENFGFFSMFAPITDFYDLNRDFSGMEVLHLLTPKQTAEMLLVPLPTPPEKDVIIHAVFDHLTQSQGDFPDFLHHLVLLAREVKPPCDVYQVIVERLYEAIPYVLPEIEPAVWASIDDLRHSAPEGCFTANFTCPVTHFNGSMICSGVDINELQNYLDTSGPMDLPCNFTLEQYACAELKNFTANQLVSLLQCHLPGMSGASKVTWKMLLSKLSFVLDPALDIIANKSLTFTGPSASVVLDVIGEMRVSLLTDEQLRDSEVIKTWFSGRLRGFLSSSSGMFLYCLSNRNLSCHTYQQILQEFSHQFDNMTSQQQHLVLNELILPFLSKPQSDQGCVSSTQRASSSVYWLQKNFGRFSVLVSVKEILNLNPSFSPLEAVELLSPKQRAEIVVLPLLAEKDVVINTVFDSLTASPTELAEFVSHLVMFSVKGNISCSSFQIIFTRLDQAMPTVPSSVASLISYNKLALLQQVPPGCITYSGACNITQANETDICVGVNTTALQLLLNSGQMNGRFCDYGIEEYACASVSMLTAQDLAAVMKCNQSPNSTGSRPVWKLFLSKAYGVLDAALDLLANTSMTMTGPSASVVLDVIGEMRVSMLTDEQLRDSDVIRTWFSGRLRGFLSSASGGFLQCLSSRNLSCHTYQQILQEFSHQFDNMTSQQQHLVLKELILPILSRPQSDQGCVSNNSVYWLQNNFGPFSVLVSVRDFLHLNPGFSPLEAVRLLSPKQSAELVVLPLPEKDVVINAVFDYLTFESPKEGGLAEFVSHLVMFAGEGNISCSSFKIIFTRLDQALPTLPQSVASSITNNKLALQQQVPPGCTIYSGKCNVTQANEKDICIGVNSTALQLLLNSGQMSGRFCDFAIEEYACASVSMLTAQDMAAVMKCNQSRNSTGSRPVWKLFLSKASGVLDAALDLLANMSMTGPSASAVLDVIGEMRVSILTDEQLRDPNVIRKWFSGRLRGFLSSASGGFLYCLSSRNLSCHTYQQILQEFSHQFDNMTSQQQHLVLMELILPFLSQSDRGCVSNSSVYWLQNNFGPFSVLVSVREFLNLNPSFSPVEAVRLLSPKQSAELMVLPLAEKDVVINAVFDYLTTESPKELAEFVSHLVMFSGMGNISCSSFNIIFTRLDQAMPTLPLSVASSITYNKLALFHHVPPGCIIYGGKCPVTRANETDICIGVNSTALQLLLNSGQMSGNFCDYGIKEYACASVSMLTAQDLAAVMKCNQSPNSTSSIPVWKLFLSKASGVLDAALDLLAKTSMTMTGASASAVLDVIGELRVSILTDEQLRDSDVIGKWFSGRLRGFLSSASGEFLYCLSSRNLSCNTYQQVLQEFSHQFDNMTSHQQKVVLTELIIPFLSRPQSDQGCVSNSSVYWLENNFGPFSGLVSFSEFLKLNPGFSPLEVVRLLSPKQSAELVVLPFLPEKDVFIHAVFDYLTESPKERGLAEFVSHLVMFSRKGEISCSSYKIIFTRLDLAMFTLPPSVASSITYNKLTLLHQIPPGCIIYSGECNVTSANETDICVGINSTALQLLLNNGQMNGRFCDYGIEEYACASVSMLTAQDLAAVMKCNQSPSSTGSRPVWKLFLSKTSGVLDAALDLLANTSMTMTGPSASMVLDVIGEMRVAILTDKQLRDSDVMRKWFSGRLRGFLLSASGGFLRCLSSRNLSCNSYQQVLKEFSHQFDNMTSQQQHLVLKELILPFLYRPQPDQGCVSNSSAYWLQNNFGSFSVLVSVREFLNLNPAFSPLEAVKLLSPKQSAELVVLPLPAEKDVVINTVFDSLTASPTGGLAEFVSHLVMFSGTGNISCSSYQIIFTRLDQALPTLPPSVASSIAYNKLTLLHHVPPGCTIYSGECNIIPANETDICLGVNGTALQLLLNNGQMMSGSFCDYGIEEYACASVSMLTAQDLAAVMKCNQSPSSTGSRPVWTLLLSKSFGVLDAALDILANMSTTMTGPASSVLLDVIGDVRLSMLTDEQLRDSGVIRTWFSGRLRGFLSSASGRFLQCLSSRNLSCHTYQQILQEFSHQFDNMTSQQQHLVLMKLILPFLSQSGQGCVSNSSVHWLQNNFGPFSSLVSVREFLKLNTGFSPLEAVKLLSPKQSAELVVLPLAQKDVVINAVFDYLTASPNEKGLAEFVSHLVSGKENISCSSYKIIFTRLDQALPTLPLGVASSITYNKLALFQQVPPGCIIYSGECNFIPASEADICLGVNSTALQLLLNSGQMSGGFCDYGIEEYACASVSMLTAQDLAAVMKCNQSPSSTGSRPVWKLFLSKSFGVLDAALDLLANTSETMTGPSASVALDVIGEMRLSMLTDEQLRDSDVIRKWFSGRLRGFLSSASGWFLQCLSGRNLSCHTYQQVLKEFSHQFDNMTSQQQHLVLKDLILPFLSRPLSDRGCVSNSSVDWLQNNFGPFSVLVSVSEFLNLNPGFSPLEAVKLLSPKQRAELVVLPLAEKDVVINSVFDYLTASPEERGLAEFLSHLVMFSGTGNISCSSYKIVFTRLDQALLTLPQSVASSVTNNKLALLQQVPPGCTIYTGECNVTPTNETDICAGVNSTALQLLVNNGQMNGRFCDYGIEEYACASLSQLTAQDLAAVLKCYQSTNSTGSNSTGSKPVWKLFLSKASGVLDAALDLLANTTFNPSNPATSLILDSIGEIRLDTFSSDNFEKPAFIDLWFKQRLSPFLPAVSKDFLSCLTTKDLNCLSYQALVEVLGEHQSQMEPSRPVTVYLYFIKAFLTRNTTTDPSCSSQYPASGEWLQKNFGAFAAVVSFRDLGTLYSNFSAMDALSQLTVTQLAEVSSTPGQLTSSSQVAMVMNHVPNKHLTAFFDDFSPAIAAHESSFPATVRSAMLQVVFDRANLSEPSVEDSSVQAWLHSRLRPLLVDLSPSHVSAYFNIVAGRSCATKQQAVTVLNAILSTLGDVTQTEIHNHIIQSLKGSTPLRCYGDNYNHSFYGFLESSFMGFQFPNLTTFISLMPSDRMPQLLNSMPPSDLGSFLRRPGIVDDEGQLCQIYQNYVQTTVFLANERLPAVVRRPTLPCVWPLALNSSDRSQVNFWFDRSLTDYLVFLNKNLLTSTTTQGATCLSFQKLVSVLGTHNYSIADFAESNVYGVIKAYLVSGTTPKCYDANDPELNSTAWFAQYIGPFMPFLTLQDLNTFGSIQVIQVFTVNPLNIALLNHSVLDANFTAYYTELIYLQDPNFNPLLLPLLCRCLAPGASFSQLTSSQSMIILYNLTTHCTDLNPEIAAALAGNSGGNLNANYITALGSQSVGLSSGQLTGARPGDIHASLGILSAVSGWNLGQAMAIIQALMTSGLFQMNSASSLFTLGSLVVGLPASTINGISSSQLLTAGQNPTFVTHMVTAPQVIKQTFVTQIISVNSNSANIIQNVPDDLAGEIPRALLQGFTSSSVTVLNKKKWKQEQAVLFFDTVATGYESSPDNLTSYVLQGFTCTRVTTMTKVLIKKLVKTCRRKKRRKVVLKETQLTCMYNYIKGEADVTTFSDYPPDVLLYYDYSLVPEANCRAYFQELADADFSVFSSALSYKRTALFKNARTCLGITTTTLTEDNISVLGNMCCKIGAAYITNSHSSILEKLKNCPNINTNRAAAMETLLLSGTTTYGDPATWNRDTLNNLGILPLYLSSTFYDKFDKKTKRQFLRAFLKVLRRDGVKRWKKRRMKKAIRQSIKNSRTKRSTTTECTVGQITQVTISDETFPFDYDDETQFNSCLSATTVKHNLAAILDKVDQEEYTSIVLTKLREAYVSESFIPEEKVQVLGPASRNATTDDITMWNITKIDTLCSLMDSSDGEWDSALAKAIISKYLTKEGNSLGSAELSCVKGPNLCSLDASVLQTISEDTLSNSSLLVVSSCTLEKKKVLFNIAEKAFSGLSRTTAIGTTSYQNTEPFLGGASLSYVRSASASNVNMDLDTFVNLDSSVVQALTVSEVSGLLGSNLAELKSYENEAVVSSWVRSQLQSELDTLGIGLTGGKADPVVTVAPVTVAPVTVAPAAPTTAAPGAATTAAGTATTGSGGAHIRADARISLLVAFALIIFSRHILQ